MPVQHQGVTYRAADAHAISIRERSRRRPPPSVGTSTASPCRTWGLPHVLAQRGGEAGIDRFLVCSVATKVEQVRSINQFIQQKCEKYPQFIGLAAWHQDVEDIQGEMDDIQARGLRGIKLHPDFQQFFIDDPRMLPVYEEAHRRGLPVLFHTGDSRTDYSSPYRLMRVIEKIPEFTCIAAHLGGYSEWKEARRELSGTNVYIDTSSSLFKVSREEAEENIAHFGVDHTMFGTDFPMWQPKEELERFFALGYSQEENQAMLYDNFARLFHLD